MELFLNKNIELTLCEKSKLKAGICNPYCKDLDTNEIIKECISCKYYEK